VTRDPVGYRGGDASLYRYVGSCPITLTDSSGLKFANNTTDCSFIPQGNELTCGQQLTKCNNGVGAGYAACTASLVYGWGFLDTTVFMAACARYFPGDPREKAACIAVCTAAALITTWFLTKPICDEAAQLARWECGRSYNRCTLLTACCGNTNGEPNFKRCWGPEYPECENWISD